MLSLPKYKYNGLMYYVYLILCVDGSIYTGITTNVDRRFREHKDGKGGHYTRSHEPKKLLYSEKAGSKSEALKREKQIKEWTHKKKLNLARSG